MALAKVFNGQMIQLIAFFSLVLGGLMLASETMAVIVPKNLLVTIYAVLVGAFALAYGSFFLKPRHAAGHGSI